MPSIGIYIYTYPYILLRIRYKMYLKTVDIS